MYVAWILSSCGSIEGIEDDCNTYYELLFLTELGYNASQSSAESELYLNSINNKV